MVRNDIRPQVYFAPSIKANTNRVLYADSSRIYLPRIDPKASRSFVAAEKEKDKANREPVRISKQFVRVDRRGLMHRRTGWTDKSVTHFKKIIAGSVAGYNRRGIKLELKSEVSRRNGPYIKVDGQFPF